MKRALWGDWPLCRCPGGGVTGHSCFFMETERPDLPKHRKSPVPTCLPFPVVGGKYKCWVMGPEWSRTGLACLPATYMPLKCQTCFQSHLLPRP